MFDSDVSKLVRKCAAYLDVTAVYLRKYCSDVYDLCYAGYTFTELVPLMRKYLLLPDHVHTAPCYRVIDALCSYTHLSRLQLSQRIYTAYEIAACGGTFSEALPYCKAYMSKLNFIRQFSAEDFWDALHR